MQESAHLALDLWQILELRSINPMQQVIIHY